MKKKTGIERAINAAEVAIERAFAIVESAFLITAPKRLPCCHCNRMYDAAKSDAELSEFFCCLACEWGY